MPIPDFQKLMLPLLRDLRSGERTGQETLEALASHFSLSIADAVAELGAPEEIGQVFSGFQKFLYEPRAAA